MIGKITIVLECELLLVGESEDTRENAEAILRTASRAAVKSLDARRTAETVSAHVTYEEKICL